MPTAIKEGDQIVIADREPSAADTKSGLFYAHYRGLRGTVSKVYGDSTASVAVASESLPVAVRTRHDAGSAATRQKWLDGLSDEARSRLSADEKKFALRYSVLVAVDDLKINR